MVTLRLFAGARELAGTGRDTIDGSTVGEVLTAAADRYGERFGQLLESCQVWRNGQPTSTDTAVEDGDEIAILPPISGG